MGETLYVFGFVESFRVARSYRAVSISSIRALNRLDIRLEVVEDISSRLGTSILGKNEPFIFGLAIRDPYDVQQDPEKQKYTGRFLQIVSPVAVDIAAVP